MIRDGIGYVAHLTLHVALWVWGRPPLLNAEEFHTQCLGWGHPFAVLFYRRQWDYERELYGAGGESR